MELRRPTFGLRQRVVVGVLIAVLVFLVTSIVGYRITEQRFIDYVAADLSTTAELEAARISNRITSGHMLLEEIASNSRIPSLTDQTLSGVTSTGALDEALSRTLDGSPFVSLTIVGSDGVVATTIAGDEAGLAILVEDAAGPAYGDIIPTDEGTGVLRMVAPMSLGNTVSESYSLVADYDLAEIQELVAAHAEAAATSEAHMARLTVDGDAEFITPLRFKSDAAFNLVIPGERAHLPIVRAVNGEETVLIGVDDYRQTSSILALRSIEETNWGLVVKMDLAEARQPVDGLLNLLLIGIAISAFVAIALLWLLFRPIMRRMSAIEDAAQTVEAGNYSHRIHDDANDELRAVSDAFDLAVATMEGSLEEKSQFVATVSHELRTPLTAVMGLADTLATEGDNLSDAEIREFSGMIRVGAAEISTLVEDLLTATQMREGTLIIEPSPTSLSDIATATVAQFLPDVGEKITFDFEQDQIALADPMRAKQIMRNLVSNAHRYGGNEITIRTTSCLDRACIQVVDNGGGVAAELSEAIFTAYLSAHARAGRTDSVGLGLSIARELARRMGGDLTYERGAVATIFELHLPRAQVEAREEHLDSDADDGPRVLVEDLEQVPVADH